MKNLSKCQKIMPTQQEIYQIVCIIKNFMKSLVQIYQGKKNTRIPQQINFVEKLEEDEDATILFIAEKQQKIIINFSLDSTK